MKQEEEIAKLREKLSVYENSPYSKTYLGILKQIEACSNDMLDKPAGLRDEDDAKAFDRFAKFIVDVDKYFNQLEYLRSKMTPEEVKKVDEKASKSNTKAF